MDLAIKEAYKAQRRDEVPVGAVLINDKGDILGTGYNRPISSCDPTSHAEINAVRAASLAENNYRLVGTSLYVTIEPCIMCMGAIIHARIRRIIYGAADLKWGAVSSLYKLAKDARMNHQPDVVSGIREKQCQKIMKDFFRNKRSK